ncbi:MAG: aminotransferase class V-fold PLP-dependent enzyme [Gammaproteobacteria bacterium]|nr:aminotransferase class V-fold PLP-dependent enzyme [Gammaproteobacteria bacterium]MCP4875537.1 aminotransferase class V-fold PLP-dependent enzyme [Gammaproteobacteria bacterium]
MEIETKAVHSGYSPDPTTNAVAVPIYQTTAYAFDDTQHGADLFNLAVLGNIYTRIMNPTTAVLEERIADMEGGVAALGLASGQAATTYAIQTITEAGDNIIATSTLYGGTYNLFAHTFPQMGIETRFVDPEDLGSMAALIDDKTKAVFCESIGNPAGNIIDLEKVAEIAHAHGVPVIVDNTVASPMLCNPFQWGADIIVHSLTKYIGGHGTIIGGVIVDSNNFDWVANKDRFKRLNEPDVSYHGVVYTETGLPPYILRARVVPLRNMGAALAPMNTFLALQGLETLPLRMERICDNTLAVARHLESHPQVEWVKYAGLDSSPHKALADKYMNGKASGILTFGIEGGIEPCTKFIDALQLITRLVNIGDAKSLACHPASTTHRQLADDELAASGVTPDLVRLSIGIENIKDIIADIDQALDAAK